MDYNGKLADKKDILLFLSNASKIGMEQAVAEALFTLTYAGGPRVFQKALIEARLKILNIKPDIGRTDLPENKKGETGNTEAGTSVITQTRKLFSEARQRLGKVFQKKHTISQKKNELKEELKTLLLAVKDVTSGKFNYGQYKKLCLLYDVKEEQFDDEPKTKIEERDASQDYDLQNDQEAIEGDQLTTPETNDHKLVELNNLSEAEVGIEVNDANYVKTNTDTTLSINKDTQEDKNVEASLGVKGKSKQKQKAKVISAMASSKQEFDFPTERLVENKEEQFEEDQKPMEGS